MSWTAACTLADLDEDTPLSVEVGDELVALVSTAGEVFAIRDECSHGKVRLSEGDVDISNCAIECYLHGSTYDLRTGRAMNLPATQPVRVFPVLIDGDDVQVDPDNPLTFDN